MIWDYECLTQVSTRLLERARAAGALASLGDALSAHAVTSMWYGDSDVAASMVTQARAVRDITGTRINAAGAMMRAGYRGDSAEASPLLSAAADRSRARGEGFGEHIARWATAILHNGLGQYRDALAAVEEAVEFDATDAFFSLPWLLTEVIEAGARSGDTGVAQRGLDRLSTLTVEESEIATGVLARCRALLGQGEAADALYAEAVDRLSRTPLRPELARAHLLYGEWLRRENRRIDARKQLSAAYDLFLAIDASAFAERARRELLATGEKVRKREDSTRNDLTPQEEQIARLAREGLSNPEIGAQLFVSARTVEWHLGNVFTKLGITSRRGLKDALPSSSRRPPP
jgi:DNA-binding CsgD family transcriptional regulator